MAHDLPRLLKLYLEAQRGTAATVTPRRVQAVLRRRGVRRLNTHVLAVFIRDHLPPVVQAGGATWRLEKINGKRVYVKQQ